MEWIYSGHLHHLPLRMLKVFLAILDSFNWQYFLVRHSQTYVIVADIFIQ